MYIYIYIYIYVCAYVYIYIYTYRQPVGGGPGAPRLGKGDDTGVCEN